MRTKLVVMPAPHKRRVRFRIGSAVYELNASVAITPVPLQGLAPVINLPGKPDPSSKPRKLKS